jgi:four helix bundle protein
MRIDCAKELTVYHKAFELAKLAFEFTLRFPKEEMYALTSQLRRSARSICLNLREAWAKRRYPAHFVSKLTDCDGEANETDSALDFALVHGYITEEQHKRVTAICCEVRRMIGAMIRNPDPFLISDEPRSA